jgi:hypothetical protein
MMDRRVSDPPRWARVAGTVGWVAPVLGFVPLHLPWILGGVLALGLISPWGLVCPRWMPLLGGRRVHAWFPLTPTVLGSALMIG